MLDQQHFALNFKPTPLVYEGLDLDNLLADEDHT